MIESRVWSLLRGRAARISSESETYEGRTDANMDRYNDVVKQGDQLITKLQKYGQVVRLRGSERS